MQDTVPRFVKGVEGKYYDYKNDPDTGNALAHRWPRNSASHGGPGLRPGDRLLARQVANQMTDARALALWIPPK